MKKGFVFSIDSVFAIVIALTLVTVIVSMQQTEKGKEKNWETAAQEARDISMVYFYTNQYCAQHTDCDSCKSAEAGKCDGYNGTAKQFTSDGTACAGGTGFTDCVPKGKTPTATEGKDYYYTKNVVKYDIPMQTQTIRGPIEALLLIDKSSSMNENKVDYKTISLAPAVFDEGKCNSAACNPPESSTNCTDQAPYNHYGSRISISPDTFGILQRMGQNGILRIWPINSGMGACATYVPKLKILTDDGVLYPVLDGYTTASVPLEVPFSFLQNQTGFKIAAWSDKALTTSIQTDIFGSKVILKDNAQMAGIGTKDGEGSSCNNYQDFENVGEINLDPAANQVYKIKATVQFSNYTGNCTKTRVKVKDPNGNDVAGSESICSTGSFPFNCNTTATVSIPGKYTVWAWSDSPITYDLSYRPYMWVPYSIANVNVGGGKCNSIAVPGGEDCYYNFVTGNCWTPYRETSTNWKELASSTGVASINIQDDLYELYASGHYDSDSYTGICYRPRIRIRNEQYGYALNRDNKNINNVPVAYSPSGEYQSDCFASTSETEPLCQKTQQNSATPSTWPKLKKGEWYFDGWADSNDSADPTKNVQFNEILLQIRRIDSAKIASKAFFDPALWGGVPNDKFGFFSFSQTTTQDKQLTTDVDDVLSGVSNVAPDTTTGGTALSDAIETGANEFSGEPNSKVMVLLTDGKTNFCKLALNPCTQWQAASEAMDAADEARAAKGIKIFMVGFANSTELQSNVNGAPDDTNYETVLRNIARDPCDEYDASNNCTEARMEADGTAPLYPECFENYPTSLKIKKDSVCGRYFYAADTTSLVQLYKLIALQTGSDITAGQGSLTIITGVGG